MQVTLLFLYSALICFPRLTSAYYIVTITSTISLPPFTTSGALILQSVVVAADAAATTPCSASSSGVEVLSSSVPTTTPCTSKAVKAISEQSKSTDVTRNAASSAILEQCTTHVICKAHSMGKHTHSHGNKTNTVKATMKAASAQAACTTASSWTSTNPNVTLPTFPLSANTTSNLSAFLQLVLSVPESVFAKGDKDVSDFFSGVGTCLASGGKGLEADLTALVAPIGTFVASFGANLLSGVEDGAKDIGKDIGDKLGDKLGDTKDIGKDIGDKLGGALGGLFQKRDAFSDLLGDVERIAACMGNVANNSTAFDVGKCAVDIALLALPVAKLSKLRNLIGAAGGFVQVLKDLKAGLTVAAVAKDSVSVLEQALGVADTIKACSVVVEDVKKAL